MKWLEKWIKLLEMLQKLLEKIFWAVSSPVKEKLKTNRLQYYGNHVLKGANKNTSYAA